MSKDISPILEGWDHQPDEIIVRKIKGMDGKEKLQMRLDMGLLQMELEGRPDGMRPFGKESYLEHYQELSREHQDAYGDEHQFALDEEDCAKLRNEAIQYYHRYLCLFQLEEFDSVVRDTGRNLRVFAFVRKYCNDQEEVWSFDQFRPYVLMMNYRARASLALQRKNYNEAHRNIDDCINQISAFFREYEMEDSLESSIEVAFLKRWADEIRENRPVSTIERLERALTDAVRREEFEQAALLRDELKRLKS